MRLQLGRKTSSGPMWSLLRTGIWFGLVTGLCEVAVLAVRKLVLGEIIQLSPHFVWMTPVAAVCFFGSAALVLAALQWRLPRLVTMRAGILAFAFLAFLSLLFLLIRLHSVALLLLAAGLAWQTSRVLAARAAGLDRLTRVTTPGLVAMVALLALGVTAGRALDERRSMDALPPARAGAPNVLLIVLDTVRASSLSVHGYSRPTSPQLERIAGRGTLFDLALSTAPWTLPAHGSMFTGRLPHELSASWEIPLDDRHPTLAEVLRDQGYLTAAFVANTFYCSYEHGLDRGFVHYEDYLVSPGQIVNSSSLGRLVFSGQIGVNRNVWLLDNEQFLGRKSAERLNHDFLRWLSRKGERPFFAFLNYFDAHDPYVPPRPFNGRFGPVVTRGSLAHRFAATLVGSVKRVAPGRLARSRGTSIEWRRRQTNLYDGAIAYLDHHLGLLFTELERRGALENTVVIITSDHGELLGEHGLFEHGNSLYLPLLHVPLLIAYPPEVPSGRVVHEGATLRDLPATVVDLLGLEGVGFPGRSLARYWQDDQPLARGDPDTLFASVDKGINEPAWEPVMRGDMQSLVAGDVHYIRNGDGREELYDIVLDPAEDRDLASHESERPTLQRFRVLLKAVMEGEGTARYAFRQGKALTDEAFAPRDQD
jgi:arylsulfatase A-like enzyme